MDGYGGESRGKKGAGGAEKQRRASSHSFCNSVLIVLLHRRHSAKTEEAVIKRGHIMVLTEQKLSQESEELMK